MNISIVSYGLQYAGYLIEASLLYYLATSRQRTGRVSLVLYLSSLLAVEAARGWALHAYGLHSQRYFYVYWSTDFLLVLSAFLLVCLFFRRACLQEEKMWRFARLLLVFIFLAVLAVSGLIFSHNYFHLFTYFIVEFNQNLYFTCLVLNTLLYLLLQQLESTDDQLGLLVCGVGIQFAGPAAALALLHLTGGERFAQAITTSVMPICNLGMLLVWAYAIVRVGDKGTKVPRHGIPALAEVT
jgi:hypothetical protein